MNVVYRDKVTPTRVLIPINGVETKENTGEWATQCIEIIVAGSDGRLICRKMFIPYTTLENQYRKEEL